MQKFHKYKIVCKRKKLRGYSLVEISIVLLIIGIVTAAIFKGYSLVESVRLDSVVSDIRSLQLACNQYIDSFSAIPGNDKSITAISKGVDGGDGDGIFKKDDTSRVFKHLHVAGLIDSDTFKRPKIGSKYVVIEKDKHPYIKVEGLSKKQTQLLCTKLIAVFGTNVGIVSDKSSVSVQID